MEYRQLGNTGIKVSAIGYGNWLNANDEKWQDRTNEIIAKCFELGINFFDTAESYGYGSAEKQIGIALQKLNVKRTDYVLTTKLYWGTQNRASINQRGLSRKHIIEGLKNSVSRLGTNVDVVYAHRFDPDTPLEETCRAFDWVIRKGLAHYWGTSEWPAELIEEAIAICRQHNLHEPVVEQPQYNIFVRQKIEKDYYFLFQNKHYGSTVWSPLASGILTGKYNEDLNVSGRFETFQSDPFLKNLFNTFFSPEKCEATQNKLKQLGEIAKELGISQAQLALGWVLKNKDISVALTSFSSVKQLEESVEAVKHYKKITNEIDERINQIFGTNPQTYRSFKLGFLPSRRLL